jgi:hypothetical protein
MLILLFKFGEQSLRFVFAVSLLFDGKLDHLAHRNALLLQLVNFFESIISFLCNFFQALLDLLKEQTALLLSFVVLLKLSVFFNQVQKSMLHVLVALLKHFIVLR